MNNYVLDPWILVPCQRSRLDLLTRLLCSLKHRSDRVVIVATQPDPITRPSVIGLAAHVVPFLSEEISISKWWNLGLDYIAGIAAETYEVLVVASDYVGTERSVVALATFLRERDLAMAGPEHHSNSEHIFRLHTPRNLFDRVPGACFMLAGEHKIRADENFRWWYTDDDLEMQARQKSGVGIVPGTDLVGVLEFDTPLTVERQLWAREDRARFLAKWGKEPW